MLTTWCVRKLRGDAQPSPYRVLSVAPGRRVWRARRRRMVMRTRLASALLVRGGFGRRVWSVHGPVSWVSSYKLLAVNVNTTDNRSKKLCYGTEGTGYRRHKRLLYSYWETDARFLPGLAGLRHTDCDPGTHDARDQNMDTRKCSCRLRHTLVPSTGVHVPKRVDQSLSTTVRPLPSLVDTCKVRAHLWLPWRSSACSFSAAAHSLLGNCPRAAR